MVPFLLIHIFSGTQIKIALTQSLVIVLCITCQSEQCRSHFLTALEQILTTQNTLNIKNQVSVQTLNTLIISVCLSAHLYKFSVALIASSAVVVLQKLSQQSDTLIHLLNGVHPLWHFLCSLLILQKTTERIKNGSRNKCDHKQEQLYQLLVLKASCRNTFRNTETELKKRMCMYSEVRERPLSNLG